MELKQVESKFSKALGFPSKPNKNPTGDVGAEKVKDKSKDMINDGEIEFNPAKKLKEQDETIVMSINLLRYKFLIVFYDIVEMKTIPDPRKNYYLEYTMFNETHKLKLTNAKKTLRANVPIIPINKLKMYYFFSES